MDQSSEIDLSHIPALAPPPGVISNFDSPKTQEPTILAVNIAFITLMTLFVGLRYVSRSFITRNVGWDDYTCLLAWAGSIAHTGVIIALFPYGYGVHMWDVPASKLINSNITSLLVSTTIIYGPTIFFAKVSILFLYLRIFSVHSRMRHWIYFAFIFLTFFYSSYLAVSIVYIFLCNPSNFLRVKYCLDYPKILYLQGSLNVATDFFILCIPIKTICGLQLSRKRKVGIFLILMAGSVACIASIVRLALASVYQQSPDVTWTAAKTSIMSAIEINIGIICGCLPALSALFRHYGFKGFHPHTVGSSATQILRRVRNTIVKVITPKPHRESDKIEDSQVELRQTSKGEEFGQGDLGKSSSTRKQLTDPPKEHNSEFAQKTQTGAKDHAWPYRKIRGIFRGSKGPALADLTVNTTLGVQIDRSLRRMDTEDTVGSNTLLHFGRAEEN